MAGELVHPLEQIVEVLPRGGAGLGEEALEHALLQRRAVGDHPFGLQGVEGVDPGAEGGEEAARQAGLKLGGKDGLIVSGSTCSPEGIEAIKAGDMIGTATADPWTQGEASAQAAIRFLGGEAVEKTVKVPEYRVTADNVGQYGEVCAK